jgi:hypothetical protein
MIKILPFKLTKSIVPSIFANPMLLTKNIKYNYISPIDKPILSLTLTSIH